MYMKEETLDKIDRYLREELTDSERNAFENALAGDDILRQRVELMRDIADAVETRGMEEHLKVLDEVRHKRRKVYRIAGVVSALAVCLLLSVLFLRVGDDNLSVPVSIPSYYGEFERGGRYSQDIVKMLRDNRYDEAISLIDSLEIAYRSEDSLLLTKGVKTEEDIYIHEKDSIALYQLAWLRIQALIGSKKYREVRESLKQYRLQEGDYRDKADSLWILLK